MSYRISEYQKYIQNSGRRHLLVEGRDDMRSFESLIEEIYGIEWKDILNLDIDTAENLLSDTNSRGNRLLVERVCEQVNNQDYANRIIGFVDREFREFNYENDLSDNINRHNIIGRLIWSRGHSIENYFFDYSIVRGPLVDLSLGEFNYIESTDLLRQYFESSVRLGCAISLLGKALNNFEILRRSMNWQLLAITDHGIQIDFNSWCRIISSRLRISEEEITKIWYRVLPLVGKADYSVIRWMCHGHIGFKVIQLTYERCIAEVSNIIQNQRSPAKFINTDERVCLYTIARSWARQSNRGQCEYPIEMLRNLEIY